MRELVVLLCLIVGISATASSNTTFIDEQLATIPACALQCLVQTVPAGGCELTDFPCICSNTDIVELSANCVINNCTLADSLDLAKANAAICQLPEGSQLPKLIIMTVVCSCIAWGTIIARLLIKYFLRQTYGWDDVFMALTLASCITFTSLGIACFDQGFGTHVWTININEGKLILYWFYVLELLYTINLSLIKLSLTTFYLRIFSDKLSFRIACYVTLGFIASYLITFVFLIAFQCTPVSYAWDKDVKPGKCLSFSIVSYSNAAFNILGDLIIFILPINEVRTLRMERSRKWNMYAMFSVGGFAIIMSIVRMTTLHDFGLSTADPTWDNVPTTFWSTLETTAAILCANMPTLRNGIRSGFKTIRTTYNKSYERSIGLKEVDSNTDPTPEPRIGRGTGPNGAYTRSDINRLVLQDLEKGDATDKGNEKTTVELQTTDGDSDTLEAGGMSRRPLSSILRSDNSSSDWEARYG